MRIRLITHVLILSVVMFILFGFTAGMTVMSAMDGHIDTGFGSATGALIGWAIVLGFIWWSDVSRVFGGYAVETDLGQPIKVSYFDTDNQTPGTDWASPLVAVPVRLERVPGAIEQMARGISG